MGYKKRVKSTVSLPVGKEETNFKRKAPAGCVVKLQKEGDARGGEPYRHGVAVMGECYCLAL